MGTDPRASGTSTASIRTHYAELEGQEATRANESSRELSKVIGSAEAMANAARYVGDEAGRTTQRAAHAATRFESI